MTGDERVFAGHSPALTLTGERTLPGIWHENYWFRRHEVVYRWLVDRVGPRVLEAGSGEGYGAQALLDGAPDRRVVAVDYDDAAARHSNRRYPDLGVVRGNLVGLPFRAESFDTVVSLQTVEHLWDQPGFVAECARVCRRGGQFVVSTPNRLTFSPGVRRGEKPLNPFHVNELDAEELVDLLGSAFDVAAVLGVRHGPRITAWEAEHGDLVAAQLAGPPAGWAAPLTDLVAGLTADDFLIGPDDVDGSLDLLVEGCRR